MTDGEKVPREQLPSLSTDASVERILELITSGLASMKNRELLHTHVELELKMGGSMLIPMDTALLYHNDYPETRSQ